VLKVPLATAVAQRRATADQDAAPVELTDHLMLLHHSGEPRSTSSCLVHSPCSIDAYATTLSGSALCADFILFQIKFNFQILLQTSKIPRK
jgi:hypothetical protein